MGLNAALSGCKSKSRLKLGNTMNHIHQLVYVLRINDKNFPQWTISGKNDNLALVVPVAAAAAACVALLVPVNCGGGGVCLHMMIYTYICELLCVYANVYVCVYIHMG